MTVRVGESVVDVAWTSRGGVGWRRL